MSKPWTEKLAPGQVTVMNSFVEQVPVDHGARAAVIDCLQALADSSEPSAKYLVCGNGDVECTNDDEYARECAGDEELYVVNLQSFEWMTDDDPSNDSTILEHLE